MVQFEILTLFLYILLWIILLALLVGLFFWIKYIYAIVNWYAVPNVTSPQYVVDSLLENCILTKDSVFIDLWCGEWDVLFYMNKIYPEATYIWYESNTIPYQIARKKNAENEVNIMKNDFFSQDISTSTHIYCYLMPHLMKNVWELISWQCKPWTQIFVNAFPFPELTPEKIIDLWKNWSFSRTLYHYVL